MRYREYAFLPDPGRARSRAADYWVISSRFPRQVLTFDHDGDRVLPLFSFEDEAYLYARYGTGEEWEVKHLSEDELLELLLTGEWRDADAVALDPVPEFMHERETLRLTVISRDSFVERLFGIGIPLQSD